LRFVLPKNVQFFTYALDLRLQALLARIVMQGYLNKNAVMQTSPCFKKQSRLLQLS